MCVCVSVSFKRYSDANTNSRDQVTQTTIRRSQYSEIMCFLRKIVLVSHALILCMPALARLHTHYIPLNEQYLLHCAVAWYSEATHTHTHTVNPYASSSFLHSERVARATTMTVHRFHFPFRCATRYVRPGRQWIVRGPCSHVLCLFCHHLMSSVDGVVLNFLRTFFSLCHRRKLSHFIVFGCGKKAEFFDIHAVYLRFGSAAFDILNR